jgi:hypothetical protein
LEALKTLRFRGFRFFKTKLPGRERRPRNPAETHPDALYPAVRNPPPNQSRPHSLA